MKRLSMLLLLVALHFTPVSLSFTPIWAQTIPATANLTASDSGACTTAGACLTVNVTNSSASSVIQLTGTFTATVQFEGVTQQGGTFVAVAATPVGGGSAVTSATATGAWRVTASGLSQIRVRCSAFTSGPVVAAITLSTGSSGTSSAGGGGGGVSSVGMTVPGGFAVSGSPVTTSGTLGLSTNAAGADYLLTSTAANVSAWEQINGGSSCGDGTHAISYSISTHLFGCQAISVGPGTVTSVGLTTPSWLTVAGSPVTTSGTLAVTPTAAQTSHQVIGTCGAATTFAPCALVTGDLPTLVAGQNGLANSATTDTTVASNISSGTLPAARLPNPSASTLGGVESLAAISHNFLTSISTSGVPAQAQPACADLSDAAASCNTNALNASNISSGTLPAARLPNPTASTLGGVESLASVSHNFLTSISTSGVPTQAQPACADLSNAATSCSVDATNASNISSGTLGTGVKNGNYPCAPVFSTTDTLTNASITTEQVFATNCSIPANSIVANKALRVWVGADATMTTSPSWTFRAKLCSVSGCGSGTVVNIYVPPTSVVATSFTAVSGGVTFIIQGAAAAGASVAVNTSVMVNPDQGTTGGPFGHNTLTTSTGGIPTNGTLFLSFSITYSSTTGTNSMTLTQLVTEWLN